MICPRCCKHTLEEKERDGITMDICQECRGIWLDRGELERLIARATQEMDRQAETCGHQREHPGNHAHHQKYRGEHDHRHDGHQEHHSQDDHHRHKDSHHHRKRHWLAELFD